MPLKGGLKAIMGLLLVGCLIIACVLALDDPLVVAEAPPAAAGAAHHHHQPVQLLCEDGHCTEIEAETTATPPLRIAIVGSGIAGASAAHFLREALPHAQLTLFEKDLLPGGRVRAIEIEGARVELGASIYHVSNRYIASFVEQFGLTRKEPPNLGTWGIWNGNDFVLTESEWSLLTLAKLLFRYGLSPLKVENLANEVKDKWTGVYDKLKNNSYDTSASLLKDLGLFDYTQQTLEASLLESGVLPRYVDELVTGIERVNYGQSPARMNAFAGYVGLAGSGKDSLFSVEGGNQQVVEQLLHSSAVTLQLQAPVTSISSRRQGEKVTYLVKHRHLRHAEEEHEDEFDKVVIATPLEFAEVSFSLDGEAEKAGETWPSRAGKKRPYQVTHVTMVVAQRLQPAYFGLQGSAWIPSFVLTTENSKIPFNSVSAIRKLNESCNLYKIFSREEISDEHLARNNKDLMFVNRRVTLRHPWDAYPVLTPYLPSDWPQIRLHDGLYYINAFESAVSCMETEIAAAKNVANLLLHDSGYVVPLQQ